MPNKEITVQFPGDDPYAKYEVKDDGSPDLYAQYEDKEDGTAPAVPVAKTEPYQPANRRSYVPAQYAIGMKEAPPDPTPPNLKAAAAAGVNIDTKLGYGDSVMSWLAQNPVEKEAFIASALKERYGLDDTELRRGEQSGELEFFNPETKTWNLAEPAAMSDLPALLENTASMAGGIAGAIGGGAVAGPAGVVAGGAAGTAGGRMAGSMARDKIAKWFGMGQDKTLGQSASEGFGEGIEDARWSLGGDAVYGLLRGGKTWVLGREVLKPDQAKLLLDAQKKADALVRAVQREVGPDLYNPNTAQKVAGNTTGRAEESLANDLLSKYEVAGKDPRITSLADIRQNANERGLQMYFENITVGNRVQGVQTQAQGGAPLRDAISNERFNVQSPLTAELDTAVREAGTAMGGIASKAPADVGKDVRAAIAQKYQVATAATRKAYKEYTSLIGIDARTGASSIDVPLSRKVKSIQKRLIAQIERVPIENMAEAQKQAILQNIENGTINLADLDATLKFLRKSVRTKSANKVGIPMDATTALELESALEKMRNKYLAKEHPEVLDALTKAERAQIEETGAFNTTLMSRLLQKQPNGAYKLTDAKVVTQILANKDPGAAKQIAQILGSNPQAKADAQAYIMALYRRKVAKDPDMLIPDYKKHKAFMDETTGYGKVVKEFFTPTEWAQMQNIGGFAEVILKNNQKLKALDSMWKADFKGKLENMSAEELTNAAFNKGFSIDELRRLRTIADHYGPEVRDAWKAGVAETLRMNMFQGDYIDHAYLKRIVQDKDMLDRMDAVFGPTYSRGLKVLDEATDMVRRVPRSVTAPSINSVWQDIARVLYAPPLSREGIIVSAGARSRARQFNTKIYNAMTDAGELNRLANRTKDTMKNLGGAQVIGRATNYTLIDEDELYE